MSKKIISFLVFFFIVMFSLLLNMLYRVKLPKSTDYIHMNTSIAKRLYPNKNKSILSSCLNPNVFASTPYAFIGILSINREVSSEFSGYVIGTEVLGYSIAKYTNLDLILMIPVNERMLTDVQSQKNIQWLDSLEKAGWMPCFVPMIDEVKMEGSRFYEAKLFSKLNAWKFIEYEAVVVIDSDTLCVHSPTDLFDVEYPAMLAENKTFAAHIDHPYQPERTLYQMVFGMCHAVSSKFNAGVILIKPSIKEFNQLMQKMHEGNYEKNWCEQGLLSSEYGSSFHVLPYKYNANLVSKTCEPSLWESHKRNIVFYHFTVAKPWHRPSSILDSWTCQNWNIEEECNLWEMF